MPRTSVIGLIVGVTAVVVGIVLKGVGLSSLLNEVAILMIIAGTIVTVIIAFPKWY
ncbi:MotA/TolQ/ExbB proton channel family protein [Bacillus chungangensis]|uniref:Flagellar motor component MotA n=1 Tax=Bacillus chungangensis TaxID=587633 RepID=A0ABT9WQV0_9BACI|nr:hypothetical protein [Bacillus chungangensis]MDQ0175672.1 flagellar motor component MotA [Bacillus chungangensis]